MVIGITPFFRACGAVVSALLVATAGCAPAAQPSPTTAHPACPADGGRPIQGVPTVSLPCLTRPDRTVTVSVTRGRPQLLNVWASWCAPCRHELPLLESAHRAAGERVQFIGVDVRDSRTRALSFLSGQGVSYPQVFDQEGALARAFEFQGVPDTVLVDAHGHVVYRHAGELGAAQLAAALTRVGVRASIQEPGSG